MSIDSCQQLFSVFIKGITEEYQPTLSQDRLYHLNSYVLLNKARVFMPIAPAKLSITLSQVMIKSRFLSIAAVSSKLLKYFATLCILLFLKILKISSLEFLFNE